MSSVTPNQLEHVPASPVVSPVVFPVVFPVLDTLRAVGALAVLTTHVAFQSGDYVRHGIVGSLLSRLDVGVAIFFVLSGFLLSRPYLARALVGERHPPTGRFYWKRFVRIFPVYLVTVVIASVVLRENDLGGDALGWLRALTLTDVFFTPQLPQGLTQMWSLSVEVTFYLLLPPLMAALVGRGAALRPRRVIALLGVGAVFSCWWNLSLAGLAEQLTSGTPLLWLPAHLIWFLVGIALALTQVMHDAGSNAWLVHWLRALAQLPGVCWTIAVGLLLVAATPLGGPVLLLAATPTQSLVKHLTFAAAAGLIVLTGIFAASNSRYAGAMSAQWLRHLGHISFSTFCIHLVVLHLVRGFVGHELFSGSGLQLWVLTVGLSLVASEVLYRLVERPGLRLKGLRSEEFRGRAHSAASATTTK